MTTSLWNFWRYSNASSGHAHARLGVVAVDVEDRRLHRLGDVAAVERRLRECCGRGGEADLVVDDEVDGAADAVAGDVAHGEALGHDALAGERGVAVDEERQRRDTSPAARCWSCDGAHHAQHDRVDGLEVAGVGGELEPDARRPIGLSYLPRRAEVVLHVARTLHGAGVDVALELLEDLVVALAHDVGEHVEAAAVGHAEHRRRRGRRRPRHRQDLRRASGWRVSAPSRPKRLVPTYLVARNFSNASAALSRSSDAALAVLGRARSATPSSLRLDPALLVGVLDVHVLDADGAAVRVAQHAEQVAERHLVGAADAAGEELAVEVPDGEAVGGRVELGRHRAAACQRSGSRSAMRWPRTRCTRMSVATCICLCSIASSRLIGLMSTRHSHRLVRHAEAAEHVARRSRARRAAARARASGTCRSRRPG